MTITPRAEMDGRSWSLTRSVGGQGYLQYTLVKEPTPVPSCKRGSEKQV